VLDPFDEITWVIEWKLFHISIVEGLMLIIVSFLSVESEYWPFFHGFISGRHCDCYNWEYLCMIFNNMRVGFVLVFINGVMK
jgi:hypothetical protein